MSNVGKWFIGCIVTHGILYGNNGFNKNICKIKI